MLTENQTNWAKRKDQANERRRTAYFLSHQDQIFQGLQQRQARAREAVLLKEIARIRNAHPPTTKKERRQTQKMLITELKKRPCRDCGGTFYPDAMEFDHVIGEKVFNISKCRGRSMRTLKHEVAKCDLVCANCHRVRTARRRAGLPATLPPPEYEI